jgi:flavodoxin
MDQPSAAIVFTSIHHGNSRRVAEALAAELAADLIPADSAAAQDVSAYDLVGLGSGIYFGRHHRLLRSLVSAWRKPPRRTFLFSTAGLPFLKRLQHASLRRRLKKQQCDILGEFCCRGWDTVGPLWLMGGINRKHPNDRDLRRVREFAMRMRHEFSHSPREYHISAAAAADRDSQ